MEGLGEPECTFFGPYTSGSRVENRTGRAYVAYRDGKIGEKSCALGK